METRKTSNGTKYREMIRINGEVIKSKFFTRKTDAKEWKRSKERERDLISIYGEDTLMQNSSITFSEYSDLFLNNYAKNQLTKRTIQNYESISRNHLLPRFKDKQLSRIKKEDAYKLINELKANGHNGKGINIILMLLKNILNHAVNNNYLPRNPLKGIKPQKEDLKVDNYWTKCEIKQFLLSSRASTHYALYYTALHTGMRLAELCGLKWDRVDFKNELISVTRTRDRLGLKETTKTRIKRILPMTSGLNKLLFSLHSHRQNDFVFIMPNGNPIDYGHVYRKLKKDQKISGVDDRVSFHDLRHTFATQFMTNGGNIFELQKLLGHTKIEMTMRYAHFAPDHLKSATKHIDLGLNDNFESVEPHVNPRTENGNVHLLFGM